MDVMGCGAALASQQAVKRPQQVPPQACSVAHRISLKGQQGGTIHGVVLGNIRKGEFIYLVSSCLLFLVVGGLSLGELTSLHSHAVSSRPFVAPWDVRAYALQWGGSSKSKSDSDEAPAQQGGGRRDREVSQVSEKVRRFVSQYL